MRDSCATPRNRTNSYVVYPYPDEQTKIAVDFKAAAHEPKG